MPTEKIANNASTTLNGGINNSTTTIVVTSAAGFPTSGNFRIQIESELLLVTGVAGTTFTVSRGIEGTGAASHSSGKTVTHILTAGGLTQYVSENAAPGGPQTNLTASDFTAINPDASATLTNLPGAILAKLEPFTASQQSRFWSRPIPANSVVAAFNFSVAQTGAGYVHLSFGFHDSTGGKFSLIEIFTHSFATPLNLAVNHQDDASPGASIAVKAWDYLNHSGVIWFKVAIISGDLFFYISPDGTNWQQVYTESATAYLDNSPNKVVFGGKNWADSSSDPAVWIKLLQWSEQ